MMKKGINVLILTVLVNQIIHIFGKLTAFRDTPNNGQTRVICASENDGGALVWNHANNYNDYKSFIDRFHNTCPWYDNSQINCKMDNDSGCLERWDREGWKLTHSLETPMGPVFDQRWEAFKEYRVGMKRNISLYTTSTIVIPFSVFASTDVHILICKNEYQTSLCYWIIIGGWLNSKSVIRKCPAGVPPVGRYPSKSACTEQASLNHRPLSIHEWRTFVFAWNSVTRNMSIYDSDQLIISYEDMQIYEENQRDKDTNPNIFQTIFFRSTQTQFIRYHHYTFLSTGNYQSYLRSPEFVIKSDKICLQLLIGLCAMCGANIDLIDVMTKDTIGSVVISGSSSAYGLPMWQSVKITNNSFAASNKVVIVVRPKLSLPISNHSHLWAVANIRECPSTGCLRIADNIIYEKHPSYSITCQKLFYQERSFVNLLSDAELNVEFDDENCDLGHVGPECSIWCKSILGKNLNCKGITICNKNGCTCPPGFQGPNCDESCSKGFYGHACKKRCGSCFQNEPCDLIGTCPTGCKSKTNYIYIPPLCQIGLSKADTPEIVFMNQTTVVATVPFKWEYKKNEEYKKLFYSFYMKTPDGRFVYQQDAKQILENTTQLVGIFENLVPDTFYQVKCILSVAQLEISSDWKTVETNCILLYAPREFSYLLGSMGIVDLKWLHPQKTCDLDLCCFRILVQEVSSRLNSNASLSPTYEIFENLQTYKKGSYTKRLYLLPSTLYYISIEAVTMRNKSGNLNFVEFRTPSSVGLDGNVILKQDSNSVILHLPKVQNDTRDSVTYMILIGPEICEQNTELPKNLLVHIGEDKINHIWQVEFSTNKLADNVFMFGGNHSANCTLKNGKKHEIVIIITEIEFPGDNILFKQNILFYFGKTSPVQYKVWFICITLIFAGLCAGFYFYKK